MSATRIRLIARVAAVGLIVIALIIGISGAQFGAPAVSGVAVSSEGIAWEQFSSERVSELRAAGKPIFIDFTAAWCLSCQVNEKVAFSSDDVKKRFVDLGVVALKADWTARDQTIAAALAKFGRNSVPLYVLYHPHSAEPIVLPEILTPGIVLDALDHIQPRPDESSPSRQVTDNREPNKEPA